MRKFIPQHNLIWYLLLFFSSIGLLSVLYYFNTNSTREIEILNLYQSNLQSLLIRADKNLNSLKTQDQYLINKNLTEEIKNIQDTYQKSVTVYESLVDLRTKSKKLDQLDASFAKTLKFLSEKNYASASTTLKDLEKQLQAEDKKIVSSFKIPDNLPKEKSPPLSGYRRQQVSIDQGNFMVDVVSADLNSTRVIVDTASDADCSNDCPVLSLGEYVARNGAFAGVNGSYFCPAAYPSCAGKTNSFDTLLMNKNKKYFNSDNNVYSNVPAVIFLGNSARFVSRSLEWGRDTSVDAVIANHPLLILNGQIVYGGSDDPKLNNRGGRSFIGASQSTVYIGVVFNATIIDSAKVLYSLGIENALNLDDGGSTALWYQGYKAGPGRNLPNAVLLIKR